MLLWQPIADDIWKHAMNKEEHILQNLDLTEVTMVYTKYTEERSIKH